jgi:hypothetical protein
MINDVRSKANSEAAELSSQFASSAGSAPYVYHELASEQHVVRVDALEQLKSNITQLEDLHNRLKFMMAEVRPLLKRN